MEDLGSTIIAAMEEAGFIVMQAYDDAAAEWTVSAVRAEQRFIARGQAPVDAVLEVAAMAGWDVLRD